MENEHAYAAKGDVWQLGILFFTMLTWELPFAGKNVKKLLVDIEGTDIEEELHEVSDDYKVFKEIIPKMLK